MAILPSQILSQLSLPDSYPSDGVFTYNVGYFPGPTAFNTVFGEDAEAARQQSLEEHAAALTKYLRPAKAANTLHGLTFTSLPRARSVWNLRIVCAK